MEVISIIAGFILFIYIGTRFYPEVPIEKEHDYLKDQLTSYSATKFYTDVYMSREDKQAHLQSEFWKSLKKERTKIAGEYTCEACNKQTTQLDLHHITYEHLGFESIDDVRLLCRDCHSRLHQTLGYDRQTEYPIELLNKINTGGQPC